MMRSTMRPRAVVTAVCLALVLGACTAGPRATPAAGPTGPQRSVAGTAPTENPAVSGPATLAAARLPATQAATASAAPTPSAPAAAPAGQGAPAASMATPPAAEPGSQQAPAAADLGAVKLVLAPLISGLSQPVYVTHAGDGSGRLFIVEREGTIRIWDGRSLLPEPFLDVRERVGSRGTEQGLLGLAFAPNYRESGFFFVNYTDRNGDTVVARFQVAPDASRADPATERKVFGVDQPAANHNGGMLAFGPDGYLYAGLGDGGGAGDTYGNGQNPRSLLAKILRLDVTGDPGVPYRVPPDNPWAGGQEWNGGPMVPEAWQAGLRNPWRFSFDRLTGDLWIADVGQNAYEEVDFVRAGPDGRAPGGLNFGWPIMEGNHCYRGGQDCKQEGLTLPVAEYTHAEGGCSVSGGYVYRGRQFPALAGIYFYGDYCSGKIWGLAPQPGGNGGWTARLLAQTDMSLSSFGEGGDGELYAVDLNGAVYRLQG